jgi:hypothetical protein
MIARLCPHWTVAQVFTSLVGCGGQRSCLANQRLPFIVLAMPQNFGYRLGVIDRA